MGEPVEAILNAAVASGFDVSELVTQIEVRDVDGETLDAILQDPACTVLQAISGLEPDECLKLADVLREALRPHEQTRPRGESHHHEFWSDENVRKVGLGCAAAASAFLPLFIYCFRRKGQSQPKSGEAMLSRDTEMKVLEAIQRIKELSKTSHDGQTRPTRQEGVTSEGISDDAHPQKVADGDSCRHRTTGVESFKAS